MRTARKAVEAALCDDLNTPFGAGRDGAPGGRGATQQFGRGARLLKAQLLSAGAIMGLLQQDPETWFGRGGDDEARIQALVDERSAAKKARDFKRADELREQLAAEGVSLEDTAQGVRWRRS
jgi:cysteinyl-tRNA synthetase